MTMIVMAGWLELDPILRDRALMKGTRIIEKALQVKGCRAYRWTKDMQANNKIWMYGLWETEEALNKHFEGNAYREMGEHLRQCGLDNFEISKFRADLEEPLYDTNGSPRADFSRT